MAKIFLNIETDGVDDLALTLKRLHILPALAPAGTPEHERIEAEVEAEIEQGVGERQRRTRRTKAQIEADKAAETGSATGAQPSPASVDPFAEQIKQSAKEADEAKLDGDVIYKHCISYMEAKGTKALHDLLIKAANVATVRTIPADKYQAVYDAINVALAA